MTSASNPVSGVQHGDVPAHVRRFLDTGTDAAPRDDSAARRVSVLPSAQELTDRILADPESLNRLVEAVGDAVERKIVRDLVRQGRAGQPGLV